MRHHEPSHDTPPESLTCPTLLPVNVAADSLQLPPTFRSARTSTTLPAIPKVPGCPDRHQDHPPTTPPKYLTYRPCFPFDVAADFATRLTMILAHR